MTKKELNAALKYWQAGLRLQDWDISVEVIVDPRYHSFGEGKHSPQFQQSEIKILDERLISPDWFGCSDWEVTLVHELLHIRFLYGTKSDGVQDAEEAAIEATSKLLVAMKRGVSLGELG